jgi:tetratricopeptide (TPR) repeat protein
MRLSLVLTACTALAASLPSCRRPSAPPAPPAQAEPASGGVEAPAPVTPVPAAASPAATDPSSLSQIGMQRFQKIEATYGSALAALAGGNRAGAHSLLDQVLDLQPAHIQAVLQKARLCREDKLFQDALIVLEVALETHAGEPVLVQEKAAVLLEQGEAGRALEVLEEVIRGGAPVPGLRYQRAIVLAVQNDREGAITALEDAVENGYLNPARIRAEPAFQGLAGDPRCVAIVERLERTLKEAQEAALRFLEEEAQRKPPPEATESFTLRELERELRMNLLGRHGQSMSFEQIRGVDGRQIRVADHAGKPLLLQLFGTWSEISRLQLAELKKLGDELKEEVAIVLLARELDGEADDDATDDTVRRWLREHQIEFPCAVFSQGKANALRVGAFPTTLFVGRDQKLYLTAPGLNRHETLRRLVEMLLAQAAPAGAAQAGSN